MADTSASEERLRLALRAAQQGAWEYDFRAGVGYRSPELQELLGVGNGAPSLGDYLGNVHPEDRPLILQNFEDFRRGRQDEAVILYRFLRDDGRALWVEQHTMVERDESGEMVRLYGLSRDVTRSKETERELVRLNADLERRVQERTRELEEERAALAAFAAFTGRAAGATDVQELAGHACEVLRAVLDVELTVYYERVDDRWQMRVASGDLPGELAGLRRGDLPVTSPAFAPILGVEEVTFLDAAHPESQAPGRSAVTAAYAPLPVPGGAQGLLSMASVERPAWSEREKAIFRAVSDSFRLALERAGAVAQLQAQKEEALGRNRALEAFAQLSRDLVLETDRLALVGRAQDIVLKLWPEGLAAYFEPEGELWWLRSQVGNTGHPEVWKRVGRGLPRATPLLLAPWSAGEAFYHDGFGSLPEVARAGLAPLRRAALLPVVVDGAPVGLFGVGLPLQDTWQAAERAFLDTAVRSLGLALERAQSVTQLAEEQRKLAAANEELEAFAYSVSHDLRTPVRHIMGFNQLLRKTLGAAAGEKSTRYLTVIDEATARMNTLIDAMLDLSRTSRLPLRPGLVDLGELVRDVRAELEVDAADRQVEWRVSPLPLVIGDPDTLRQVLVNLLSNALKYTRPRPQAHIDVWTEERPEAWAVFVRDDGVGFDPRYSGKLFGVFQRLHRQDEFEGTGVGLANVRRIINRHGGQVWAEGVPGGGATFAFSLPRQT
ncbi:PAS domain-containing sensor histidine kinase [Deinococcus hopiensis]|uniref:histidine kinase n=1 Tax=Deinococcus hopiensis KR-140 TaxID=695939 RepID=A0A1W1UHK2_9DEIO|nr:ATP-binding protein [Deinococcus hopiensis]SMB80519.1 PAS domain S-box-containing protein [Deinococcus hopiensis KR-140]